MFQRMYTLTEHPKGWMLDMFNKRKPGFPLACRPGNGKSRSLKSILAVDLFSMYKRLTAACYYDNIDT